MIKDKMAEENAALMGRALIELTGIGKKEPNGNIYVDRKGVIKAFYKFVSFTDDKYGKPEAKEHSNGDIEFILGEYSYLWNLSDPFQSNSAIYKILYEVFYKHQ
ncbi:hypothetical protein OHV56_12595 [Acinetobacter baumannii]|nr:hypothetical protein [Acinetobacter baumannii]